MGQEDQIVYAKEVLEFVAITNDFNTFLEESEGYPLKEWIGKAQQLLSALYYKILQLPELHPDFEDLNQRFVTEDEYEFLRNKLLGKLGEYDAFEEVFDEHRLEGNESVGESISENLADIYQDTKDFTKLFEIGTNEVMYEALWEIVQSFETFWGQKLVNTLRALHHMKYGDEEIEENLQKPGENRNFNADARNWIIGRRQEDFRNE
jgi:hypothetical protein